MKSWNELFDLKGQTAIVTGVAMGIGEGIARRLAERGASVVIGDIDATKGREMAAQLSNNGSRSIFVPTDVRDFQQVDGAVAAAVREFGHLDILVNNAGIFPFAPALDVTPELWDRVQSVNLRGAFFLAQAAAREMHPRNGAARS